MHAVALSTPAVAHYPQLAPLALPFTALVAASRPLLGLHYPSDVLAGALLGALMASIGLCIWGAAQWHPEPAGREFILSFKYNALGLMRGAGFRVAHTMRHADSDPAGSDSGRKARPKLTQNNSPASSYF